MLEKEEIQYRGFRNTYDENGNPDGFEFCFRSTYYRGVWLSQLRVGRVIVDGEEFLANSGLVTWIIQGKEYTPAEMAKDNEAFWPMTEPAIIRVKKPGGLAQGWHDIGVRWGFSSSYMPPSMEYFHDDVEERSPLRRRLQHLQAQDAHRLTGSAADRTVPEPHCGSGTSHRLHWTLARKTAMIKDRKRSQNKECSYETDPVSDPGHGDLYGLLRAGPGRGYAGLCGCEGRQLLL